MSKQEIIFDKESLLYLRKIMVSGKVSSSMAPKLESIYQKIQPGYTLCRSCLPTLSSETNRIIRVAERFLGYSLESYSGERYTRDSFKGMTSQDIATLVINVSGVELKSSFKNKKGLIKEALTILNK